VVRRARRRPVADRAAERGAERGAGEKERGDERGVEVGEALELEIVGVEDERGPGNVPDDSLQYDDREGGDGEDGAELGGHPPRGERPDL
jgi:hypothetical protein